MSLNIELVGVVAHEELACFWLLEPVWSYTGHPRFARVENALKSTFPS